MTTGRNEVVLHRGLGEAVHGLIGFKKVCLWFYVIIQDTIKATDVACIVSCKDKLTWCC